jgi:hypothetical protein
MRVSMIAGFEVPLVVRSSPLNVRNNSNIYLCTYLPVLRILIWEGKIRIRDGKKSASGMNIPDYFSEAYKVFRAENT